MPFSRRWLFAFGLMLITSVDIVSGSCPDGDRKYGPNCNLDCHCESNTCDRYSGRCNEPHQCQAGWFGPTCQIENQAYNMHITSSLAHGSYPGSNAVDGSWRSDIGLCFHAAGSNENPEWLRVNLGGTVIVREIWVLNRKSNEERMQQVTTTVGTTHCYYHGPADTGPSQWLKGKCSSPLTGSYVTVSRPVLRVGHLTVCELGVASNPAVQKPKPGKVRNLRISNRQMTQLTVEWEPPEYTYLVLEKYEVFIYSGGSDACSVTQRQFVRTEVVEPDRTERTITGLVPSMHYEVTVRAVTLDIEGGGAGEVAKVTKQAAADPTTFNPTNLRISNTTSTSTIVEWDPPLCQNWKPPFLKYRVFVYVSTNGSVLRDIDVTDYNTRQITLTNLMLYTSYRITIQLLTGNVTSTGANISVTTLPPKPLPPKNVSLDSNHWNVLTWDMNQIIGMLEGFVVRYTLLSISSCDNTTIPQKEVTTMENKITLSTLLPGSLYRFSMITKTNGGESDKATFVSWTKPQTADPSSINPRSLKVTGINSTAVAVTWEPPPCRDWKASFEKYVISVLSSDSMNLGNDIDITDYKTRQTIVGNLTPFTSYVIRVKFATESAISTGIDTSVKTLHSKPLLPKNVHLDNSNQTILMWERDQVNGKFEHFTVRYTLLSISGCDNTTRPQKENTTVSNQINLKMLLLPGSLYTFSVVTKNGWGESDKATYTAWTKPQKPDPPVNINGTRKEGATATFVWEGPGCQNYRGIHHSFPWELKLVDGTFSATGTTKGKTITVEDVKKPGNYSMTVSTLTDFGLAVPATAYITLPEVLVDSLEGRSGSEKNNVITIAAAAVASVLVISFIVFFIILWRRGRLQKICGKDNSRKGNADTQDMAYDDIENIGVQPAKSKEVKKEKKSSEPIALDEKPTNASIGSATVQTPVPSAPVYAEVNKKKSKKENGATKDAPPAVYSEVNKKTNKPPLAAKLTKPSKPPKPAKPTAIYSNTPSEVVDPVYISARITNNVGIPVDGLVKCVEKGKANKCAVFKKEFEKLPKDLIKPAKIGKTSTNEPRNRFKNIVPYDDSSVVLKDHETDYVNASHVVGFSAQQRYIAAQAPKVKTLPDFLALIWQQNVGVVVMLNKPVENGKKKCELYWPEDQDSVKAAGFTVTMTRVEERSHFFVRHLVLTRDACGEDGLREERHVTQYHYTNWPDFGVPALTSGLVELRNYVREKHGPQLLLVHCTAGVGRTGSFIALDLLLDKSGRLPVWETVDLLRQQRTTMVQTLDQYVFLHDALAEAVVGGHTTFSCPQFSLWVSSQAFAARTEAQFSVLQLMIPEQPYHQRKKDNKPSGMRRTSFTKDVSVDIIFMGSSGEEELYLSESKVKPESQEFWDAVVKEEVTTVTFITAGPQKKDRFPPKGERKTIGKTFALECLEEKKLSGSVTEKRLNLDRSAETVYANVKEAGPRSVTVMEVTGSDVKDITQVVQLLVQSRKPMLVPDSPASGCVVVGATSAVSRARRLQEVDVYSATKSIILALPALSPTLEQFRLTHQVVAKYLGGNDEYANFR